MKFDPQIHHRRSIRLKDYDYSQPGKYFVTMVTFQRECLFGEIVDGGMKLNLFGKVALAAWFDLPRHYDHISQGAFCIMPNHVHGIIILNEGRGESNYGEALLPASGYSPKDALPERIETRPNTIGKRHRLPEIVRAFKSFSARRINGIRRTKGVPVWQRNYYEHIIRDPDDLNRICRYIESNPSAWDLDDEN